MRFGKQKNSEKPPNSYLWQNPVVKERNWIISAKCTRKLNKSRVFKALREVTIGYSYNFKFQRSIRDSKENTSLPPSHLA